jgi:hypothetical protein
VAIARNKRPTLIILPGTLHACGAVAGQGFASAVVKLVEREVEIAGLLETQSHPSCAREQLDGSADLGRLRARSDSRGRLEHRGGG